MATLHKSAQTGCVSQPVTFVAVRLALSDAQRERLRAPAASAACCWPAAAVAPADGRVAAWQTLHRRLPGGCATCWQSPRSSLAATHSTSARTRCAQHLCLFTACFGVSRCTFCICVSQPPPASCCQKLLRMACLPCPQTTAVDPEPARSLCTRWQLRAGTLQPGVCVRGRRAALLPRGAGRAAVPALAARRRRLFRRGRVRAGRAAPVLGPARRHGRAQRARVRVRSCVSTQNAETLNPEPFLGVHSSGCAAV